MRLKFICLTSFLLGFLIISCDTEGTLLAPGFGDDSCVVTPLASADVPLQDFEILVQIVDEQGTYYSVQKPCGSALFDPIILPHEHVYYIYVDSSNGTLSGGCTAQTTAFNYTVWFEQNDVICGSVTKSFDSRPFACVCLPNANQSDYHFLLDTDCYIPSCVSGGS